MRPQRPFTNKDFRFATILLLTTITSFEAIARGGGGGGHSSHGSSSHSSSRSSSHSSSSHSSSSHSYSSGGGSISCGGGGIPFIFFIIIIFIVYNVVKRGFKSNGKNIINTLNTLMEDDIPFDDEAPKGSYNFPEGLTPQKISTAFMEIQSAWQMQDLSKVRKWISDGVYQRFTAQFEMMQKLTQHNRLDNIRISDISVASIYSDRAYECVDVIITFSMDDHFVSDKYPSLNESYEGDMDSEYWTFIRRKDSKPSQTDLYSSENCPNCGASLDHKLGEVSRCPNCKTLVNNASYDWILSEITQDQNYNRPDNSLITDPDFISLVENDPLFAKQRMEDIASNVFMQIMEVLSGDNNKKLDRFASDEMSQKILQIKQQNGVFIFDRLYLNDVTLTDYTTQDNNLNLHFQLGASYKRVRVQNGNALWLDRDFIDGQFKLTLSKSLDALKTKPKEIAYSYECASCGAPYDDTTNDTCTYCGAPVVDILHNWVLTEFIA